jgi:hypothetical protein
MISLPFGAGGHENRPMVSVFEKRGFEITHGDDLTVEVVEETG